MTDFTYTVIKRPKKFETGRTDISWAAECGRDAVTLGGFLITSRALKGTKKQYTAVMTQGMITGTFVGDKFETRAQAAFAIWRKYYEGWRTERRVEDEREEAIRDAKRQSRVRRRFARQTPEGQQAYKDDLNRRARERRAAMTAEERVADAAKRRAKREQKAEITALTTCM